MLRIPMLAGAMTAVLLSAAASRALADPLNGTSLPAGTHWVMHLDTDGARMAGPLWNLARVRIWEPQKEDLLPKLTIVERMTGMKLPQDLHDVTLYGSSYEQAEACVRIHGPMDKAGVVAFLRGDPGYREVDHNGYTIMQWRDNGANRLMFGSFAKGDLAILSPSSKAVEDSLDTLDGKAPALKADSPLSPPPAPLQISGGLITLTPVPQAIVWMAGTDLADLPRAQKTESPLLGQMEAASISIKWVKDKPLAEVKVVAKSEKVADDMRAVAEGVKAFVSLAAMDEHAPPQSRLLSAVMQNLSTEASGKVLKATWSIDMEKVDALAAALPMPLSQPAIPVSAPGKLP